MYQNYFSYDFLVYFSEHHTRRWSYKVVVLVVGRVEEEHLLHTHERQARWEETSYVGYAADECWTSRQQGEIPCLVEWLWSKIGRAAGRERV